jgi:ribosomal protein S6--L-glutamate ligase
MDTGMDAMMNIGIITVRDRAYHPTRRLSEAAEQRGHRVTLIHPYRVWPVVAGNILTLTGEALFAMPDVVLPRQGAQIGQSCLVLINHLSLMGIPLVNDLDAIRLTRNQFLTLQALAVAGVPVPDTFFINAESKMAGVVKRLGGYPVVVKQVNGRQGSGVTLVKNETELETVVQSGLERTQGLLLQKFFPTDGRRDIRALVIGQKVAGTMCLEPIEGEFRANYHLGATGRAQVLPDEVAKIAIDATRAVGLEIAGVDLILDKQDRVNVIEVNYSPGFKGLEKATGIDVAGLMVDYAIGV